jgi:hypothetical protein
LSQRDFYLDPFYFGLDCHPQHLSGRDKLGSIQENGVDLMQTWNVRMRELSLLLAMTLLFGFALVLAGQVPVPSATPGVPQQEKDFTFSVYYSGNMRGNLEPCG